MFRRWRMIIIEDDNNLDQLYKLASNCGLQYMYKIGIYGQIEQKELFVKGTLINYLKFIKALKPKK